MLAGVSDLVPGMVASPPGAVYSAWPGSELRLRLEPPPSGVSHSEARVADQDQPGQASTGLLSKSHGPASRPHTPHCVLASSPVIRNCTLSY